MRSLAIGATPGVRAAYAEREVVRLDVDLGFDAAPSRGSGDGKRAELDLHGLAAALRSPQRLRELLRNRPYDEVRVREGDLPLSALQAVCLLVLAAVPAPRFVVDGRSLGRKGFALRAATKAAVAVPDELLRTAALARRVKRASKTRVVLPRTTARPQRAIYLRVDPSLTWFGAQVGGAATHTSGVINGLLANGVEVDVLAAEQPVGTDGARFVHVPPTRALHLVRGLTYAEYGDALVSAGMRRTGDVVYQRYQLGSDAGLVLARRLNVPLVLEFNGSELWVQKHWNPGGGMRLSRPLAALERRNLYDASLVVVVSRALRDTVVAEGAAPERVLVNPNGVDVDELAPYREGTPAEWRARVRLPDGPTIGFIGTFGLWHGVKLLPRLAAAVPEARWVIIGDGDLYPEVRAEMERRELLGRVSMTGVLARPQALARLAGCDVCVSPHVPNPDGTPFFGSPTKLFEYMGLRKAIVASNLEQIGEVLEHERTGLLCEPGNVEEAAAAVRVLLGNPELRARLGDAAFRLAAAEYTWTAHVRRILSALAAGPDARDARGIGSVRT